MQYAATVFLLQLIEKGCKVICKRLLFTGLLKAQQKGGLPEKFFIN